jgi:hypothetical protein
MGGGLPSRDGIPHPRHRGPQRRQRSRCPRWARRRATAGPSVEEAAHTAEAPVSAAGVSASAAVAVTGAAVAPPEPSRKWKRGFSSLR